MFWGCFAGTTKGPGLIFEKAWGSIDSKLYCERVLPLIESFLREHPDCLLMQDNAPAHIFKATQAELARRGIKVIKWPPYLPDLNLIEKL